ncbi:MAG: efflux RND transporter periplasmic adaptor subunit [Alphaproteobacteria bacterium]
MNTKRILVSLMLLGSGGAAGALGMHYAAQTKPPMAELPAAVQDPAVTSSERKILYWTDPMIPGYRSEKPGKSPMGMDLVPVYEGGERTPSGTVEISPATVNNLGVRTAPVERRALYREIETVGFVDYDERKISHVHTRTIGWIEELRVKSEGERVRRGDLLFRLFSPELVKAQQEFLQALRGHLPGLADAAGGQLRALGVTDAEIERLQKDGRASRLIDFYAPQDGVVAALPVRQGMYVDSSTTIVSLADLSSVWVIADVFDIEAPWVKVGERAEVRFPYLPSKVWDATVEFVYPSLDPRTRTLRVRLRLNNASDELKPQMYAAVKIFGEPRTNVLAIPRDALIPTAGEPRVVKALGDGRFRPTDVEVGIEAGDRVEVRRGLSEGDSVVVQAQFLLDSESSLSVELRRLDNEAPRPAPEAAHSGAHTGAQVAAESEAPEAEATGTVVKVDETARMVTISHSPITAIGWPAMTMGFLAAPDVSLAKVKAGAKVDFRLRQKPDGSFEIIAVSPAKN